MRNHTVWFLILLYIMMLPLPSSIFVFFNKEYSLNGHCFGCFSSQLHQIKYLHLLILWRLKPSIHALSLSNLLLLWSDYSVFCKVFMLAAAVCNILYNILWCHTSSCWEKLSVNMLVFWFSSVTEYFVFNGWLLTLFWGRGLWLFFFSLISIP